MLEQSACQDYFAYRIEKYVFAIASRRLTVHTEYMDKAMTLDMALDALRRAGWTVEWLAPYAGLYAWIMPCGTVRGYGTRAQLAYAVRQWSRGAV